MLDTLEPFLSLDSDGITYWDLSSEPDKQSAIVTFGTGFSITETECVCSTCRKEWWNECNCYWLLIQD